MARFSLAALRGKKKPPESDQNATPVVDSPSSAHSEKNKAGFFLVEGFRDSRSRPRYIIWTGVGVLLFAVVMILALGVTSTYWFCASVCHKVQDDTIIAYNRSTHNEISCMACHEPVNANPIVFVMKKAESLGELYLTATNKYELPLNPESEVSKEMTSEQCTQCHNMGNRVITPTSGIIIDHKIHAQKGMTCSQCHNRVAHNENFALTLKNPNGEPNKKHEDFMKMPRCVRCHTQEKGGTAPGACSTCHLPNFQLTPENHSSASWYTLHGPSNGHSDLAQEDREYCPTCHSKKFCADCHGVVMPHPAGFQKNHVAVAGAKPQVCANCHTQSASAANAQQFCSNCHHQGADPKKPWLPQHSQVVDTQGAEGCFECHNPTYCAECHVNGGKNP